MRTASLPIYSRASMILLLLCIVLPTALVAGYIKLRQLRTVYANQLPCPKLSIIWGHLQAIASYSQRGTRKDRHFDYIVEEIAADLDNPPFIYLDVRPIRPPTIVIRSHELAERITRVSPTWQYSMAKAPIDHMAKSVLGIHSMVITEGEEWKSMRKRYNPGFQPKYLQSLLPGIINHIRTFSRKLSEAAETGEVISLGEYIICLTFDIIGVVTLDCDFKAQSRREDQTPAFRNYMNCLNWLPTGENPLKEISPVGMLMRYYYRKISDREVMKLIQKSLNMQKEKQEKGLKEARPIVNLSFQGVENITPILLEQALHQVNTFLFAGHDTTASVLQWAIFQLSVPANRHFLDRVRVEHDIVFGTSNTENVENMIISTPDVFGKLILTNAIIKESLRLYPPVGTARTSYGQKFMVEWKGKQICLDNATLYIPSYSIHRDKSIWGEDVGVFNPDRWIKGTKSYRKVPESAFRPFERGPRSCIGQELAYIEAKAILVLILRKFDFKKIGLDGISEPEVYNTRQVTAKPVDRMRMQVSFVTQ